ncbi:MAG TPA: S1C family serine protease [Terriglobales bacterium]|nr:S1C family serine protease [Terriglobales bacterium]
MSPPNPPRHWMGVLFLALPLLFFGTPAQGQQTTGAPEEVIAKSSPTVVLILIGQGGEVATGQGSGVIVQADGLILTAYHLVKNAVQVQVQLKSGEVFDRVELLGVDERRDIAALRVTAHGLPALLVASAEGAKPGEAVYVVSNPAGLAWTASSGIFSALRLADEVEGAGKGFRLMQFTAPVSPGSSGGALVDSKGNLLGLVVGARQGQNLNFAVPAESVMGLTRLAVTKTFASASQLHLRLSEPAQAEKAGPQPVTVPNPPAGVTPALDAAGSPTKLFIREKEGGAFSGFPAEPLEKKLLENTKFREMGFSLQVSQGGAEILIQLDRPTLSWDCTYRITNLRNGAIIGAGKTIAWDCIRAAPGVAEQIVADLQKWRGPSQPAERKPEKR